LARALPSQRLIFGKPLWAMFRKADEGKSAFSDAAKTIKVSGQGWEREAVIYFHPLPK